MTDDRFHGTAAVLVLTHVAAAAATAAAWCTEWRVLRGVPRAARAART